MGIAIAEIGRCRMFGEIHSRDGSGEPPLPEIDCVVGEAYFINNIFFVTEKFPTSSL